MASYKIKEAAEELGVSRQTVYNWIDRIGKDLDQYIYKAQGPWLIDKEGLELIRQAITSKEPFTKKGKGSQQEGFNGNGYRVYELLQEHIDSLKEQTRRLEQELDRKNQQFENFQVLLKQNQERILELEGDTQEKQDQTRPRWWKLLFGRG